MKTREIFKELLGHLQEKQITVVTGMRRVGKTTALKYILQHIVSQNKIYLDLEKIENRYIFNQPTYKDVEISLQIEGIDFSSKAYIILDEIQLVPNLPSVLKYLYDTYEIKFVVSGSSSYYLKNHFSESLAGRKTIFEMKTLSFFECLDFKDIEYPKKQESGFVKFNQSYYNKFKSEYQNYLTYGGFPEVVMSATEKTKVAYLKDIINSYIELDVKLLSDFSQSDNLYKLILLLAKRAGSKLEYSKLSSVLGINQKKVKDYILLLEYTYFIHLITPFSRNSDREISQQQKLYFTDNGILSTLGINNSGVLLENSMANQLSNYGELNYYARKNGQEIDFILSKEIAFEVKETPVETDLKILQRRAKSLDLNKCFLIGLHPANTDFVWAGTI